MKNSQVMKNTSNEKRGFKVMVTLNSVESLITIRQRMPLEVKQEFVNRYGKILNLLDVSVGAPFLSALAQFWNADLRCFELPQWDMTPTIEEYAQILRMPVQRDTRVYKYLGHYLARPRIAAILGMEVDRIKLAGSTSASQALPKALIDTRLLELLQLGDWRTFNRVLALAIFGLVLFPSTHDMVDVAAIDIFFWYEMNKVNSVPAILAETFLSLGICKGKKGGKFRGCAQMLYVWAITHMYVGKCIEQTDDPLRTFQKIPMRQREEQEWKEELTKMDESAFKWVCPWYTGETVILRCGKFPNVPLMGPRGCISYTPAIVLRQLRWTQGTPQEDQLGGYCFLHSGDTIAQANEIRAAWDDVQIVGKVELGKRIAIPTPQYLEWRQVRMMYAGTPKESSPNVLSPEIETLKAQIAFLLDDKENSKIQILILQRKIQKLEKEVDYLKDECADAYDAAGQSKKPSETERMLRKLFAENQGLQAKIGARNRTIEKLQKEKEEMVAKNEVTNQALEVAKARIAVLQDELTHANSESLHRREMAKKYYGDLMEARQREGQLKRKIVDLHHEIEYWKQEAQRHEVEKESWVEGWKAVAEVHKTEKNDWEKRYATMSSELHFHTSHISRALEKAEAQRRTQPSLYIPSAVEEFIELCKGYTEVFKKKRNNLLM